MSVNEIEFAAGQLSVCERAELLSRLVASDDEAWNKEIEDDVNSGRLDAFFNDDLEQYNAGLAKSLQGSVMVHFALPQFWQTCLFVSEE